MTSRPPLVLVVEDEADAAALYEALLTAEGMEVVRCRMCNEARRWWRDTTRAPDLVVLDVSLPDDSGLELCRELIAHSSGESAVMMISAHGDPRMATLSRQAGAQIFLDKLKDLDRFVEIAQQLVQGQAQ